MSSSENWLFEEELRVSTVLRDLLRFAAWTTESHKEKGSKV